MFIIIITVYYYHYYNSVNLRGDATTNGRHSKFSIILIVIVIVTIVIPSPLSHHDSVSVSSSQLRLFWLRVLETSSSKDYKLSLNREYESEWALGLPELLPHIQQAIREKYEYLTISTNVDDDGSDNVKKIIYRFKEEKPVELVITSSSVPEGITIYINLLEILRFEFYSSTDSP